MNNIKLEIVFQVIFLWIFLLFFSSFLTYFNFRIVIMILLKTKPLFKVLKAVQQTHDKRFFCKWYLKCACFSRHYLLFKVEKNGRHENIFFSEQSFCTVRLNTRKIFCEFCSNARRRKSTYEFFWVTHLLLQCEICRKPKFKLFKL